MADRGAAGGSGGGVLKRTGRVWISSWYFFLFLLCMYHSGDATFIKAVNKGYTNITVYFADVIDPLNQFNFDPQSPDQVTTLIEVRGSTYNISLTTPNLTFTSFEEVTLDDSHMYTIVFFMTRDPQVSLTSPDSVHPFSSLADDPPLVWDYQLVDNSVVELDIDQALVTVVDVTGIYINKGKTLELFGISDNCYKCTYQLLWPNQDKDHFVVNTDHKLLMDIRNTSAGPSSLLKSEYLFGDHGVYILYMRLINGKLAIQIETDTEPQSYWSPLIVAIIVGVLLAASWALWIYIWKTRCSPDVSAEEDKIEIVTGKNRVLSLDSFRGLAITVMIFVNYGGGGYNFMAHSEWNGLTIADLVFPWFIWIMGSAMAFSLRSAHLNELTATKVQNLVKIFRRSIILFALGLFLNNGYDLANWRIPGVLQRFSISYLVVALIMFIPTHRPSPLGYSRIDLNQDTSAMDGNYNRFQPLIYMADLIPYSAQWLIILVILLTYLLLQFFLEVPGCGRGYLGPGGIGDGGLYASCTGGAHGYLDKLIYGERHIYQHPTCQVLYKTGAYDPEGFLGYLTSIVLCYLGVLAGRIIVHYKQHKERVIRWVLWGVLFGIIGTLLCGGTKDGGAIPINKNMWSVSFIFVMAGTAFLLFALFYVLIDVYEIWNGAPFIYVGMNPIILYCAHELLSDRFPFSYSAPSTHAAQLLKNIIGVTAWLIVAFRMYQLKFFVSI